MKVTKKSKSSFQLEKIYLKKSVFEIAKPEEPLDEAKIGISIGIDSKRYGEENRQLECALTTTLKVENQDTFKFSVTMVGKFIIEGDTDFDANDFLQINAPSIIYPYIRQHVRSVSLEADINPIILPIINFLELNKQ